MPWRFGFGGHGARAMMVRRHGVGAGWQGECKFAGLGLHSLHLMLDEGKGYDGLEGYLHLAQHAHENNGQP